MLTNTRGWSRTSADSLPSPRLQQSRSPTRSLGTRQASAEEETHTQGESTISTNTYPGAFGDMDHVKQTRNFGLRNRADMHARPRVEASAKGSKDILLRFSTELRLLTEVAHQKPDHARPLCPLSLSPTSGISQRKRNRHRPMRPKPFIATRTIAARELCPDVTPFDVVCAWACSRDVLMSEVSQQRGI